MVWRPISWERFSRLSPALREEYLWRFGKVEIDWPFSLINVAFFLLVVTNFLVMWFFFWKEEPSVAMEMGWMATLMVRLIAWVVLAEGVAWLAAHAYFSWKEYVWLKEVEA